jgi:hypothetical protein
MKNGHDQLLLLLLLHCFFFILIADVTSLNRQINKQTNKNEPTNKQTESEFVKYVGRNVEDLPSIAIRVKKVLVYFYKIPLEGIKLYHFRILQHYTFSKSKFHDLYSSPNIVRVIKSRRMRWAGHVAHMGEGRGAYRVLVGRPKGKRPLGRPRRRWEDNIKMYLEEIGIDGANWIRLARDRVQRRAFVNTVMNFRVP